jgi:hypothetical protein
VGLEQAVLRGEARGLGAGGRTYLVVDGAEVGVYGARTYVEVLCYLGVGYASGHELEHIDLAGAQSGWVLCWGRRLLPGGCLMLESDAPSCRKTSHMRTPSKRPTCRNSRWQACQKVAMIVKLDGEYAVGQG